MNSFLAPLDIPRRLSLSCQAATAIRKGIAKGTWDEYLPSERRLCEMFQVSRPTIRTALHQLSKEGLVDIRQGRRNRLLSAQPINPQKQSRLIGLVTHEPTSQMTLFAFQGISEMRTHLAEQGFTTVFLVCPPGSAKTQHRKLEEFVRQNRVFCCVMLSVSLSIQQWFSTHAVPALVLGSCHPEVDLPSLDIDYHSVCRHAAGTFLGKGHRRIALLVPDSKVAGDIASETGFCEAVAQHSATDDDTKAIIIRHNGTARNISSRLDAQFNSSHPPTALLVAKPQFVFAVIIYLLKRGLTVPDTISFISRDNDHVFANVSPPIAHYSYGEENYAHRLSRLMLQMVNQGNLPTEPNLIFPKFMPGGTVKPLSA